MFEVTYQRVDLDSTYFAQLLALFQSQWPAYQPDPDSELPKPLVAIVDNKVVGGLAYTLFNEPNSDTPVIWLNAVYVAEAWRGKGIAHKLLWLGKEQVKGQPKLYAYTDKPSLYESLGWSREEPTTDSKDMVMSCTLG